MLSDIRLPTICVKAGDPSIQHFKIFFNLKTFPGAQTLCSYSTLLHIKVSVSHLPHTYFSRDFCSKLIWQALSLLEAYWLEIINYCFC